MYGYVQPQIALIDSGGTVRDTRRSITRRFMFGQLCAQASVQLNASGAMLNKTVYTAHCSRIVIPTH